MNTEDPYELVHQLSLIQEAAGVDREVRELFAAYARLRLNRGRDLPDFSDLAAVKTSSRSEKFLPQSAALQEADPRFRAFIVSYSNAMIGQRLPVILSVSHFARKLGVTTRQLVWLSWNHDHLYRRFTRPKPSGGERVIHAPFDKLKTVQGWIHRRILAKANVHRSATGFRRGVSIVDNARRHTGKSIVVRIDLKDFFPTITHRQARQAFQHLGYPFAVANLMANLCTFGGVLPQGAATSPALANLVCHTLDERLYRLSLAWRCRYTRYADDLVFSSRNEQFPALIPFIKSVIAEEGFVVNEDKVRVMRRGNRQQVTGLVVNEKPNLSRQHRRQLRAMAHRFATRGPQAVELPGSARPDADPTHVLTGHLAFLRMVDPSKAGVIAGIMHPKAHHAETPS